MESHGHAWHVTQNLVFCGKTVPGESLEASPSGSQKMASQKIFPVAVDHTGVIFGQVISRHNTLKRTEV